MTGDEAVGVLLGILRGLDIDHMLVGSLSTNVYGIPRATKDADMVLLLKSGDLQRIEEQLPNGFVIDAQATFEMVTSTRRYSLNIKEIPFEIELFMLSEDVFDQSRFHRRRAIQFLDKPTFVPSAEDVILQKLLWFHRSKRAKDRIDARDVLYVQKGTLDWDYLNAWSLRQGTSEILSRLRVEIQGLE